MRHFEGYPSPRGLEDLLDLPHLPKTPHSFQSPNAQSLGKMAAFCLVDTERDALFIIVQLDSFSQQDVWGDGHLGQEQLGCQEAVAGFG